MSRNNKGFTLIEVMVIAPIVVLVIGALISSIIIMTGDVLANRKASFLQYSIQDALDRIEADTKISGGFLATNNVKNSIDSIGVYDKQGYNNNNEVFTNVNNTYTAIILNSYATTSNPADSTRNIVYSKGINACGSALEQQNSPVMLNTVYFIKNGTLWRRIVAPFNYIDDPTNSITGISCNKPWQQPSCSEVLGFCKAKDIKLVEGVTSFEVTYYKPPYTTAGDADKLIDASTIGKTDIERNNAMHSNQNTAILVTIKASGKTAGRKYSEYGTIRAVSPSNYFIAN